MGSMRACMLLLILLLEISPAGAWAIRDGGNNTEVVNAVWALPRGESVVTGYFTGSTFLQGNSYPSEGQRDIFIARYADLGGPVWVATFGSGLDDEGLGIHVAGGVLYVCGYYSGPCEFDSTRTEASGGDFFLMALDPDTGLLDWVSFGGGILEDRANAVSSNAGNEPAITGFFCQSATFTGSDIPDLGPVGPGNTDGFTAQYSTTGEALWARRFGGAGFDAGTGICRAGGVSYLNCGFYSGSGMESNSHTLANDGGTDLFVQRLGPMGLANWLNGSGGPFDDKALAIAQGLGGRAFLCGNAGVGFMLDGISHAVSGATDVLVAELDPATGSFDWGLVNGGPGVDSANALVIANGELRLAGEFEVNLLFPGLPETYWSYGGKDAWWGRFDPSTHMYLDVDTGGGLDHDVAHGIGSLGPCLIAGGEYQSVPAFFQDEVFSNAGQADIFLVKHCPASIPGSVVSIEAAGPELLNIHWADDPAVLSWTLMSKGITPLEDWAPIAILPGTTNSYSFLGMPGCFLFQLTAEY
jgi:hypothetical protein